ncbi:hypothetical protein CCR75_001879 [Bremia lactucae]|uniref:Uncharacterized protein n=1 Tax=Bremia lactucae TaxID=4779 RepID=A0A976FIS2_BRELC|nr:hypothetical protein CCR75_001879 [Bremia lactucae]
MMMEIRCHKKIQIDSDFEFAHFVGKSNRLLKCKMNPLGQAATPRDDEVEERQSLTRQKNILFQEL